MTKSDSNTKRNLHVILPARIALTGILRVWLVEQFLSVCGGIRGLDFISDRPSWHWCHARHNSQVFLSCTLLSSFRTETWGQYQDLGGGTPGVTNGSLWKDSRRRNLQFNLKLSFCTYIDSARYTFATCRVPLVMGCLVFVQGEAIGFPTVVFETIWILGFRLIRHAVKSRDLCRGGGQTNKQTNKKGCYCISYIQ